MEAGVVLGGKYQLDMRLGRGGMGEVWAAHDVALGRPVAVKIVLADLDTNAELVARLRQEARTAARLQHSGITVVHDIGDHDGHPYFVMELLDGHDFTGLLAEHPDGLPADLAVGLMVQVAGALAYAHGRRVVHRDIKPANLMRLADGGVKICDFGIARYAEATTGLTAPGGVLGTPAFMAPEQYEGHPADARTDLYAFGATLHILLVGKPPFPGPSFAALMRQHLATPPPLLHDLRPGLPAQLGDLLQHLLAKAPIDRPTTATQVENTLRAVLEQLATPSATTIAEPGTATRSPHPQGGGPIDRAVRIAVSIDDPEKKAEALFGILQAAPELLNQIVPHVPAEFRALMLLGLASVADDADVVRHLLDQAEPFFALIPEPHDLAYARRGHLKELSRLAGLMAAVDPDGARQLMERVESAARELPPDPRYTWVLPELLVEIANAGSDADRHCSRRLIDAAEQAVLGLDDPSDRDSAFRSVAAKVARADPMRAERIIGMITERWWRVSAWTDSIKESISAGSGHTPYLIDAAEQALVGPVQPPARRRMGKLTRKPLRERGSQDNTGDLADIAIAAAAADTLRAEHLAMRITDLSTRAEALVGMARQDAADPDQARRWLAAAYTTEFDANSRSSQLDVLAAVAGAAAAIDPALAVQAAQRVASALGEHESPWSMVQAAEHLAAVDPGQAVRLVDLAEARTEPLDKGQRHSAAKALVTAAAASATTDPQYAKGLIRRAWQTVRRSPAVDSYVDQVWWPLNTLADLDPHAAEDLVDQLPGPDRDPLLRRIVTALAVTDPLSAERAAHAIADDGLRKQALVEAAVSIARHPRDVTSADPQ